MRTGREGQCEAPPMIFKKNKIQIIIKTRLNLKETENYGLQGQDRTIDQVQG